MMHPDVKDQPESTESGDTDLPMQTRADAATPAMNLPHDDDEEEEPVDNTQD